jgi:hypothetical protein
MGDEDLRGVGLSEEKITLSFTSCLYFQIMYIEAGNLLAIYGYYNILAECFHFLQGSEYF